MPSPNSSNTRPENVVFWVYGHIHLNFSLGNKWLFYFELKFDCEINVVFRAYGNILLEIVSILPKFIINSRLPQTDAGRKNDEKAPDIFSHGIVRDRPWARYCVDYFMRSISSIIPGTLQGNRMLLIENFCPCKEWKPGRNRVRRGFSVYLL